jgi:putative membrane protein
MADDPQNKKVDDPRVYFAAERTLLAWLRTGLALMGVGFAVARFGLFLREMQAHPGQPAAHGTGLSLWSGVGLVVLGVLVEISAVVRHIRLVRQLSSGTWQAGKVSGSAIVLGTMLGAIGVGIAVYLILR